MRPDASIIIPALDEALILASQLQLLQPLRRQDYRGQGCRGQGCALNVEIIVVDGGSQDATVAISEPLVDQVVVSTRGRALQMNAGAACSSGEYLVFLHADTTLPRDVCDRIASWSSGRSRIWGFFPIRLSGRAPIFRLIETMMNWRSRLTGIGTGDQCLFVHRELFGAIGGFADIPLMEDIEICKRLKRISKPYCENIPVETSSRKWEREGVFKTMTMMWRLRLAYFFGVAPEKLVHKYYRP